MIKSFSLLTLSILLAFGLQAKSYQYTLSWEAAYTHTYHINLETEPSRGEYTDFKIAAWRPGRYITQDYAAAVSHFEAHGAHNKSLRWTKTDKDTWRVYHLKNDKITVSYRYYADNDDAGSSLLEEGQAYFNPVNCFMYIADRLDEPVKLEIPSLPKEWKAATALTPTPDYKTFIADSWHNFADCPSVFSNKMHDLTFSSRGAKFYLHFQGDYLGDASVDSAIVKNISKICNAQADVIDGKFPFSEYHFIYRLLDYNMRHAVEHTNSASFVLPNTVTANANSVIGGICGISSHEFWHLWNVKRIRPAALVPYNYTGPQYTGLHWFTEGVTEYYTSLTEARAGVIGEKDLFTALSNNISAIENSYANEVVSPWQSSFDSWLATSPYLHPYHNTSYYTLGERVGFMIDMRLRVMTDSKYSLDDVFRKLWSDYYLKGKGVPEKGIEDALESLTGKSWADFFEDYVYGTKKVDYEKMFKGTGLEVVVKENENAIFERIGITKFEKSGDIWTIARIHAGGDAYLGGLAPGMSLVSLNDRKPSEITAAFFTALKVGDILTAKVYQGKEIKTVQFPYKGLSTPKVFSLQRKEKISPEEVQLLDKWVKGR